MILGTIVGTNFESNSLAAALASALTEVLSMDRTPLAKGRYDLSSVPGAFVLVQEGTTKAVAETRPEAHRAFIDIQILTTGRERFGLAHAVPGLQPVEDRYADRDIAFYPTPDGEFFVEFKPGDYGVFFPGELHRPFLSPRDDAPGQIRKLVVKIPAQAVLAPAS